MSSIASINRRIDKLEVATGSIYLSGAKYIGRYYDELTDAEKDEYLRYWYGSDHFNHSNYESFWKIWDEVIDTKDALHFKCEKAEPPLKIGSEAWNCRVQEIKEFMRQP